MTISELMAMGFSRDEADRALKIAHGDLEQAVGFLLMGEHSRSGFEHIRKSINAGDVRDQGISLRRTENGSFTFGSDGVASSSGSNLEELVGMGYDRRHAEQALSVSGGDMDQAINFLLMGESRSEFIPQSDSSLSRNAEQNNDTDLSLATALQQEELNQQIRQPESGMYRPTSTHRGEVPRMVATDSFLTTPGSGPFCTCVAASIFLDGGFITAESLNSMLQGGIELFRKANGNTKSIDKILSKFGKSRLGIEAVAKNDEEPKQGVFMEHDLKHNVGLRKLIAQCRIQQEAGWGILLLETDTDSFCIAMPPKGTTNKFWYFDFLPRSQFRVPGAYARVHNSMLQMEESLESILKKVAQSQNKEFISFALHTIRKCKT